MRTTQRISLTTSLAPNHPIGAVFKIDPPSFLEIPEVFSFYMDGEPHDCVTYAEKMQMLEAFNA